tara:strand:+ start:938 stop:1243 length:306 start_codon:yes stop_codon:yes gene_type:complete
MAIDPKVTARSANRKETKKDEEFVKDKIDKKIVKMAGGAKLPSRAKLYGLYAPVYAKIRSSGSSASASREMAITRIFDFLDNFGNLDELDYEGEDYRSLMK